MPIYPSPKQTLTLTSHLGQNVGLGERQVGSFPDLINVSGFLVVCSLSRKIKRDMLAREKNY